MLGTQFHCFLSYTTREDEVAAIKPLIDHLIGMLQQRGVGFCPVYYDGWYLRRGEYADEGLRQRLFDAIASSLFTVAMISPGYLSSPWCQFECRLTDAIHALRPPGRSLLPLTWKADDRGWISYGPQVLMTDWQRDPEVALQSATEAVLDTLESWEPHSSENGL